MQKKSSAELLFSTEELKRLRESVPPLVAWDRARRRSLPWRENVTPYRVWVSEIMLQQTRIEAVIPYFLRFMEALPTLESLADCPEERLLKLWEGLGYYSRARNLKKAAQMLVKDCGGVFPRSAEELKKLPGVGSYTAGAISSMAFGEPECAVDGNVLRVVMRLLRRSDEVTRDKTREGVSTALRAIYPRGEEAGLLTEGLMELGETLCLPNGEPLCGSCPLSELCLAHEAGEETLYPVRAAKKERRREELTVLVLRCEGRFALRKRPARGLLAGLWELPQLPGFQGEREVRDALSSLNVDPLALRPLAGGTHLFTHVEWHMRGYLVDCGRQSEAFRWFTAEEIQNELSIPTAFRPFKAAITQEKAT